MDMKPGYASTTMKVTPELLNGAGVTHGCAIFALADTAFATASNSHGTLALALNININFLKTTRVSPIMADDTEELEAMVSQ